MRKIIILVFTLVIISSCGSGLYKATQLNLDQEGVLSKSYDLDEFDIYTYCICEDAKQETNNKRFFNCSDSFHDIPVRDTILKVEEVYLLKHKKSDIILYLTTFSDKYIEHKKGFLNDRSIYENKVILNKLEYAYIGKMNTTLGWLQFPDQKGGEDVILHYNQSSFPDSIEVIEANIATAENKYTTDEKISLANVFRQPLVFNKRNYELEFYEKGIGNSVSHFPKCVNIISMKGKVEVVFGCKELDTLFFKISNRKVRYNTNYFLLPE